MRRHADRQQDSALGAGRFCRVDCTFYRFFMASDDELARRDSLATGKGFGSEFAFEAPVPEQLDGTSQSLLVPGMTTCPGELKLAAATT